MTLKLLQGHNTPFTRMLFRLSISQIGLRGEFIHVRCEKNIFHVPLTWKLYLWSLHTLWPKAICRCLFLKIITGIQASIGSTSVILFEPIKFPGHLLSVCVCKLFTCLTSSLETLSQILPHLVLSIVIKRGFYELNTLNNCARVFTPILDVYIGKFFKKYSTLELLVLCYHLWYY